MVVVMVVGWLVVGKYCLSEVEGPSISLHSTQGIFNEAGEILFVRFLSEHLDFDVYTCWEGEALHLVHRLAGRLEDVEEAFVGADLELFAGVFVCEGGAVDGDLVVVGGEWDRTSDKGTGAFDEVDDHPGDSIDHFVVVGEDFDADLLLGFGHLD